VTSQGLVDTHAHLMDPAFDADRDEVLARARNAGVARLVFNLPPAKADEVLPLLDRCAVLMRP